MFIAVCPITGDLYSFSSLREACLRCIKMNKADDDHPAYRLYRMNGEGEKAEYFGRLCRKFGEDFNPDDCWRK